MSIVYFIQSGSAGPIKIGKTDDLSVRLGAYRTYSPAPIRVLGVVDGGVELEADLHRQFADLRGVGEWFRPDARLLDWIDKNTRPEAIKGVSKKKSGCELTALAADWLKRIAEIRGLRFGSNQKAVLDAISAETGIHRGSLDTVLRGRVSITAATYFAIHELYLNDLRDEQKRLSADLERVQKRVEARNALDALKTALEQ